MTLAELRTKLESVNDWLVDAENEFTHSGDLQTFTDLHSRLDEMLEVVVDAQWILDEGGVLI